MLNSRLQVALTKDKGGPRGHKGGPRGQVDAPNRMFRAPNFREIQEAVNHGRTKIPAICKNPWTLLPSSLVSLLGTTPPFCRNLEGFGSVASLQSLKFSLRRDLQDTTHSQRHEFNTFNSHPRPAPGPREQIHTRSRHPHPRVEPLLIPPRRRTHQPDQAPRPSKTAEQDHTSGPNRTSHNIRLSVRRLGEARGAAGRQRHRPVPGDPHHASTGRRLDPGLRRQCLGG